MELTLAQLLLDSPAPALRIGSDELSYTQLRHAVLSAARRISPLSRKETLVIPSNELLHATTLFLASQLCGFRVHVADARMQESVQGALFTEIGSYTFADTTWLNSLSEEGDGDLDSLTTAGALVYVTTSGTWAKPKLVALSHEAQLLNARMAFERIPVGPTDRIFSVLPLSHSYQQVAGILAPLLGGSCICMPTSVAPTEIVRQLAAAKATHLITVPRVLIALRKRVEARLQRIPFGFLLRKTIISSILGKSLKTIICGGAALDLETDRYYRALGIQLYVGYGLTEAGPIVSITGSNRDHAGDVGQPLRGVTVTLSKEGTLQVGTPSKMNGYHNAQPLADGDVLDTGDLGVIAQDGSLRVLGRKKEVVMMPSGEAYHMAELEELADQVPGVAESRIIPGDSAAATLLIVPQSSKESDDLRLMQRVQNLIEDRFPPFVRFTVKLQREPLRRTHTLKITRHQDV